MDQMEGDLMISRPHSKRWTVRPTMADGPPLLKMLIHSIVRLMAYAYIHTFTSSCSYELIIDTQAHSKVFLLCYIKDQKGKCIKKAKKR